MKLSSLAICASLAFASVASQAMTVSYSDTFNSTAIPFSKTLSLSKFDGSLGTLTGVTLTLAFDVVAQVDVLNLGNENASFASASAAFPVTVTSSGADATSFAATATAISAGGNAGLGLAGQFSQPGLSASGSATRTVALSSLPSYVGGASDNVAFGVSAANGTYTGVGPTSLLFSGSGKAAGTLSVSYDYDATSPVPEPSTAVLMGLGMLAIGVSLRRRRRED
jgi:hypothetical protein